MKDRLAILAGVATFGLAELAWVAAHGFSGGQKAMWIMKTGTGIGVAFVAFVAVAALVSARQPTGTGLSRIVLPMTGGGLLALIVTLFAIGAGSLWPIVIVFNGAILAVAALVGAAVGAGFRRGQSS